MMTVTGIVLDQNGATITLTMADGPPLTIATEDVAHLVIHLLGAMAEARQIANAKAPAPPAFHTHAISFTTFPQAPEALAMDIQLVPKSVPIRFLMSTVRLRSLLQDMNAVAPHPPPSTGQTH